MNTAAFSNPSPIKLQISGMTCGSCVMHVLDMPAMTMVFRVAQSTMLDTLKQGDKVKLQPTR